MIAATTTIFIAFLTDRFQRRYLYILGCSIETIGYVILLAQDHMAVFFIAAAGTQSRWDGTYLGDDYGDDSIVAGLWVKNRKSERVERD